MAGKYKVDIKRGEQDWRRRSAHKTHADARLQSQRNIKKEPSGNVTYRITLDGETIELINRDT